MLMSDWKINTDLEKAGLKVVKLLKASNYQAFWVGGIVRNNLLKRKSDNIDIATDATPDQVEKILLKQKIKIKPVGKQFGSILAILNIFPIEITTFRSESCYSDNRHPDQVEFIKDYLNDAKRRDFTINALYFDPVTKELFDPTGGIKDLKDKLLRFIGDPKKRIDEDALRMLRGVRFATQLGFSAVGGPASGWKFEKNSFAAIKTRAKYIQQISGERVKAELDKILLSEKRVGGLILLDKSGLLKFIVPQIERIKNFSHKSKLYHLEGTIFDHTLLALSKAKNEGLDMLYAILFHDIGKPETGKKVLKEEGWVISTKGHAQASADIFIRFAKKLRFPRINTYRIEWLIRNHMHMVDFATMNVSKQLDLANNPAFGLLLKHWQYDEIATKRKNYLDDHHKKFLKSLRAGKKLLKIFLQKKKLIAKYAKGAVVMRVKKLEPGPKVGEMVNKVIVGIVLGKIKNERDLKRYL